MSDGKTTIKVPPATRDRLRAAKVGGETYDETINRLLDKADEPNRRVNELASGDA